MSKPGPELPVGTAEAEADAEGSAEPLGAALGDEEGEALGGPAVRSSEGEAIDVAVGAALNEGAAVAEGVALAGDGVLMLSVGDATPGDVLGAVTETQPASSPTTSARTTVVDFTGIALIARDGNGIERLAS